MITGSDNIPVALVVQCRAPVSIEAEVVFLPTPHRLLSSVRQEAIALYKNELLLLGAKLGECGSKRLFDELYAQFAEVVQRPWRTKVRQKPWRFNTEWTRQMDTVARARTLALRRATRDDRTVRERGEDLEEVRRLSKVIKKLVRAQKHLLREDKARCFRQSANRLSPADVSARLKRLDRESAEADQRGAVMEPAEFTRYFADDPRPEKLVRLRQYVLPKSMERRFVRAIMSAKTGKAAGPDGVPIELFQLCPDEFGALFFQLFRTGARLGCVISGWDLSILIPLFKKGDPAEPANYRALRLVLVIRKVFEIAVDKVMGEECPDELAQFGFSLKTSAMAPAAIVLSHLRWKELISLLLDLIRAYDLVQRDQLMDIVDSDHTPPTCGMVAMLLQPSEVRTQGDEKRLTKKVFTGVTQGGPASPRLYKKSANVQIRTIEAAVAPLRGEDGPMPVKAFADDFILQLLDDISATLAFRAAGRCSEKTGQLVNFGRGKSAYLVQRGEEKKPSRRFIGGGEILADLEADYLGVPISTQGSSASKTRKRVAGAAGALARLMQTNVLVRGMDVQQAREVYRTFIEARWTYACFLVPMDLELERAIDAVDAEFVSEVLSACTLKGKNGTLAKARALLRLDSPRLVRQIKAHQFVASVRAVVLDESLPADIREKARLTIQELPYVRGLGELVEDLDKPWDKVEVRRVRERALNQAFEGAKRKAPQVGERDKFMPWLWKLPHPWARALAARYFFNTFPIFNRTRQVGGKRVTEKAVKTKAEKRALLGDLQMLQHVEEGSEEDVEEVVQALIVLRGREAWAREKSNE